jgi:hypothetical protein
MLTKPDGDNRYCAHLNVDYMDYLNSEDPPIYMNFFDWMSQSSRTKLLQSYDEYWRRLNQYFALFNHRSINPDVMQQVRRVRIVFLFIEARCTSYGEYTADDALLVP